MNANSIARPLCWILGVPLLLLGLAAISPAEGADVANTSSPVVAKAQTPAQQAAKKAANARKAKNQLNNNRKKNKSSLGKSVKKHHKHKHHHKRKHHKHHKKNRTSANNQVSQDLARVQRDEAALTRDIGQLKRALRK